VGLADVVLDDVPLADALTRVPLAAAGVIDANGTAPVVAQGTLDVLPVGSTPSIPAELVGSSAVAKILDELTEAADVVLVDAPPLLAMSDAVTLGARVDAVLVAVRLNVTDREILDDLARALKACPCAKLGYVLTGAEPHKGYGYYMGASTEPDGRSESPPRSVRQRPVETRKPAPETGTSEPRWG
jgi:Mrp family chromosome partitioning ATPase